VIEVRDLSFSYGSGTPEILSRISCELEQGHCIAILGNNGAGKSTLLKCLNRIHRPRNGSVLVDGEDILRMPGKELAKRLACVPQRSECPHIMVFDAVLLGRKPYIQWDTTAADKAVVEELLERLHLSRYATRYLDELSGGELQKVVLARALAQQPKYLLLDEPTSNLDPKNQHEMMRTVQEICRTEDISVVVVIHDLNLAVRYCDRFLFMKEAGIYAYGGIETVTAETIREVYGMEADVIEYGGKKLIIPL